MRRTDRSLAGFTLATLAPLPLLLLAAFFGGAYGWAALAYLTVFITLSDRLVPKSWRNRNPQAEFPASEELSLFLGVAHLWMMVAAVFWLGGPNGVNGRDAVIAGVAFGIWFGQVSHPNAHELIHRPARQARQLGRLVYISLLFGHHASSHPKVHHRHVATPGDPNTARAGEGFWRYALRAWTGSFAAGFAAEHADLKRAGKSPFQTPYVEYVLGAVAMVVIAYALAGWPGVGTLVALSAFAQYQVLMSDYVQHYGLRRAERADGRYEPVGPQHSWNSPHAVSGAMMMNAPRHSDHHVHPGRPYPALQLNDVTMPILPYSLPVMGAIAVVPPLWRRVMDRRLRHWQPETEAPEPYAYGQETAAE
ncbi:alkane 1-monooxygenase [Pseudooceanicola sp. LIPI14-2-Ac024]|uniref:alkane 1-monooxygenase n=1 Tax=Pseudooceanicola sp. LIPI14-2-Ac024 TaxID=3344875 RepID=UPI0035CF9FD3